MQSFSIPLLGNVRLQNGAFRAELTHTQTDGVLLLDLSLHADAPTVPEQVVLSFEQFLPDVFAIWTPNAGDDRYIRADWASTDTNSRSASGAPVTCLHTQDGMNRLTVSLSDAAEACCISVSVSEEFAVYTWQLYFFTQLTAPLQDYSVQIRLDYRPVRYETAVRNVVQWWDELYPPCAVPDSAREPLYSCWYSMHQNVSTDDVIRQCTLASPYGMKTVIIDDGWQTEDNSRGYAYCGDWKLARKKIPDMTALADAIHALGMQFMIWYSVPFVGVNSENYTRFIGKYLDNGEAHDWYILDPRFPECRAFLVETYRSAVRDWHLDGLKLDFIDSFHLTGSSSTDYDAMDCVSLEEAVQKLLEEVCATLKGNDPDFLIEFRQSYIGPVMRRFGNMLRAGDCPYAAGTNRRSTVALRLTSGKTAVHSDMVMWNVAESAETAADQLTAILYAVPQVSVRMETLPQRHRDMLRFYLRFWTDHRSVLLDGELTADDPHAGYSLVRAEKNGEAVITAYAKNDVSLCGLRSGALVNASPEPYLIADCDTAYAYTVTDCTGAETSCGVLPAGLTKVDVPHSGVVFFRTAD
jgi:alpha-galactosidase